MSVRFLLSDIPSHLHSDIIKSLTIKPRQEKFFGKDNKFNKGNKPVKTLLVEKEDEKTYIRLPYRFACAIFNKIFNNKTVNGEKFPGMFASEKLEFHGELLDRQVEPVKEALQDLKNYRTCSLILYPGFGKTFIGAYLSYKLNKITCILLHRDLLIKQWVSTFKQCIPGIKIWVTGVKKKSTWNLKDEGYPSLIICMAGRVDKIPLDLRNNVGTLIVDEAHCLCSESRVKPLLSFSPRFIIMETATPDEAMYYDIIKSVAGTHVVERPPDKPYHCFIIHTGIDIGHDKEKNQFTSLITNQCDNEDRNCLILDLVDQNRDSKIMIASPRVPHCKLLADSLNKAGIPTSELHSTIKKYETKQVLVGSVAKMGVGFDEKSFCDDFDRHSDCMIITLTFKKRSSFEQIRGRCMRTDNPIIVYLYDRNSICSRHMSLMRKWIKETNGTIHELHYEEGKKYNFKKIISEYKD